MTRYVVDAAAVMHLARKDVQVAAGHTLLAPTLLRSQVLAAVYEAARRDELTPAEARDLLARIWKMPIRLLGDGVLRRRAWAVAEDLGWPTTYDAEYIALTLLQADAFVTLDDDLARAVQGVVRTAPIGDLRA